MSANPIAAQIKAKLTVERAGVTLGAGLVDQIVAYLTEDAEVKDVSEFVIRR